MNLIIALLIAILLTESTCLPILSKIVSKSIFTSTFVNHKTLLSESDYDSTTNTYQISSKNQIEYLLSSSNKIISKTIIMTSLLLFTPIIIENSNFISPHQYKESIIANADSTGKFSTKLTAKRRYLPRVIKNIPIFDELKLGKKSTDEMVKYFKSEDFSDLIRAMKLYGNSLKRGELPDDISRKTEKLADSLQLNGESYVKSVSNEKLVAAIDDFYQYIKFSEIHSK